VSIAREPWRLQLGGPGADEALGRSGRVLDGRIGEIGTAVGEVRSGSTAEGVPQPGKDGAPKKPFTILRKALNEVMALGFQELDAAIALKDRSTAEAIQHLLSANPQPCAFCGFLKDEGAADPSAWHNWYCYDCWQGYGGMPSDPTDDAEDADLQAALRMSVGETADVAEQGKAEDAMMAEAMRLSIEEVSLEKHKEKDCAQKKTESCTSFGGFVLGEDYPFPLLEPVSLKGTDDVAAGARAAQQQRDAQIAQAEARRPSNRGPGGRGYGGGACAEVRAAGRGRGTPAYQQRKGQGGLGGVRPDDKEDGRARGYPGGQQAALAHEKPARRNRWARTERVEDV